MDSPQLQPSIQDHPKKEKETKKPHRVQKHQSRSHQPINQPSNTSSYPRKKKQGQKVKTSLTKFFMSKMQKQGILPPPLIAPTPAARKHVMTKKMMKKKKSPVAVVQQKGRIKKRPLQSACLLGCLLACFPLCALRLGHAVVCRYAVQKACDGTERMPCMSHTQPTGDMHRTPTSKT